jgi:CRP-like cAMP-binding protein
MEAAFATDELIAHMAKLTTMSGELEAEVRARVTFQAIEKGRFLHRAGTTCSRTYFVTQGLVRSYYCKGEKEITDFFAAEGEWITATESFMKSVPDQTYLQALEPSGVCSLSGSDLAYLFAHYPAMERFGRMTISHQFVQQSTRLAALRFSSAKDKYALFCEAHRSVLARLPLGMIASYLGIAPETLSRVRGQ